jgi:PQ loop repeat
LLLFLIYFPRASLIEAPATSSQPKVKSALAVMVLSVLHFIVVAALTFYFSLLTPATTPDPDITPSPSPQLTSWANFLGVQSTILASLQYLPQLYTTWTLKHVGSLSIPMMCIQTSGSFVWAISLASREGTKWSSWITYVVTGILQGALLTMCIMWEVKDRKEKGNTNDDGVDGERRPLLNNETS